jgi:deoxyribodipyrimidine photolyase-related protein
VRHLVLVLGDQLNRDASAWDGFDAARDVAWMAEASEESTHVWSSKQRISVFLAAMRHFAQGLRDEGLALRYRELADGSLASALSATLRELRVERVIVTQPGDWRVLQSLRMAVGSVPLEVREDRHFLCRTPEFEAHASGRKSLRMEYFYREMRRRHGVLMDGAKPAGGAWNFDAENRGAFGANGPGFVPAGLNRLSAG